MGVVLVGGVVGVVEGEGREVDVGVVAVESPLSPKKSSFEPPLDTVLPPSCGPFPETSLRGRVVVKTSVVSEPSGRPEVVVMRFVIRASNGVVVVVSSGVVSVVSGALGAEEFVTIRFNCRGK